MMKQRWNRAPERFPADHVGERGQRVVFAEREAGEEAGQMSAAARADERSDREGHGGERHLRELRQVEQAFGWR